MAGRIATIKDATNQTLLENVINILFPGENASIVNPSTGYYLEIDLWLPNLKVCFEFQDAYHYTSAWYSHVPLNSIQLQDASKRSVMLQRGDTLIIVPCWWDGSPASLMATVRFHRPDLYSSFPTADKQLIPLNPPLKYFDVIAETIPDVGELMLASFSISFRSSFSAKHSWWLGEKYDGLRICWNPRKWNLYTRTGLTLNLPESFNKHFPTNFLDAEVWFGRGRFMECQKLIKASVQNLKWHFLRVVAFDEPGTLYTQSLSFEDRYTNLIFSLSPIHPFIIYAARTQCKDKKFLEKVSKMIINDGGEGVILRKPCSLYEHGRSPNLIKVKAVRGDQEGIITQVAPDGSLHLKLPSGLAFSVPASNVQLTSRPKRGDIVSFSYESYSRYAVPLHVTVFRIRQDLSWGDVIRNYLADLPKDRAFSGGSKKGMDTGNDNAQQPHSHWTGEKGRNMRAFFESFAKKRNFDPLIADHWYNITRRDIVDAKGITILAHFNWGLINTLVKLFPDVKFDVSKFASSPKRYWSSMVNRKKFFINFAKDNNFDPLIAENWYQWRQKTYEERKGAYGVLGHYHGSAENALIHLFPDIGLIRSKFKERGTYWLDINNRREVLEKFASDHSFDPLLPHNWYSAMPLIRSCKESKNIMHMLEYYKGSLVKAVNQLFPSTSFDESKFTGLQPLVWHEKESERRKFFEEFAKHSKFDPLVAANWYSVSRNDITSFKGTKATQLVASHHDSSLVNALIYLFPSVSFSKNKFQNLHTERRTYWSEEKRRRKMMEEFAKHKGFDPLVASNWTSFTKTNLVQFKGRKDVLAMLAYHSGSYVKALTQLLPEVAFNDVDFNTFPKYYWQDENNRRKFFLEYAEKHHFNPLLPENWYPININTLVPLRGAGSIVAYYGSFKRGLMTLFPKLNWNPNNFLRMA